MPPTNPASRLERARIAGFATQAAANGLPKAKIVSTTARYKDQHAKRDGRLQGLRSAIKAKVPAKA